MLAKLKRWFETPEAVSHELSSIEAATVLMIEIMMADDDQSEQEEAVILRRLSHRSAQDDDGVDVAELLQTAQAHRANNADMYAFTKTINQHFDEQQKLELIMDLWRTALADGQIDPHEEHLIRRINHLLNLHHSHFIKAKLAVQSA